MAKIICSIGNGIDWCGHESDGADDSLPLCSRHRKLINEPLREQIEREILAKCKNEKETNTSEFGSYEVSGCLEFIQLEDTAYCEVTCTHIEDAAIAGGNK